jgi:hypothetical protein
MATWTCSTTALTFHRWSRSTNISIASGRSEGRFDRAAKREARQQYHHGRARHRERPGPALSPRDWPSARSGACVPGLLSEAVAHPYPSICCVIAPGRKSSRATTSVESVGGRPHGRSTARDSGDLVSRGRLADVYEARDRLVGRTVAIKVLAPAFERDRGFRRAVPPRDRAAARLNQRDIVAAFEMVAHDVSDARRRGFPCITGEARSSRCVHPWPCWP